MPLARSRLLRWVWLGVAMLSLGVACVGLVLPGLPSTEFVLLAAWAAARSSPRLHQWLLQHKIFGAMLRHWADGKRLSRRAKWAATVSMSLCAALLLWTVPHPWLVTLALVSMACVLVWLWFRPEPVSV